MFARPAHWPNWPISLYVANHWALLVNCDGCRRQVVIPPAELARRFEGKLVATLDDVGARLRCASCGGRDGSLGLRQDHNPETADLDTHRPRPEA